MYDVRTFTRARRQVFVQLPQEEYEEGMCGELVKAMYGTRDAAQNWEHEYCDFMHSMGFRRVLRHHVYS